MYFVVVFLEINSHLMCDKDIYFLFKFNGLFIIWLKNYQTNLQNMTTR